MPKLSQAGVDGRVPVDGGWRMKRVGTAGCVGLMVTCVSVFGLAAETGTGVVIRTGVQEVTSSVLDGVFTAAQALRGQRVYNRDCVSCHGPEFEGDEMAPSIAGSEFIGFWTEFPVGSLFERIKVSMPADDPGRLSDEEYTDVLAYLLDASSYPSGESELPADKAALDQIMIVAPAE